MSSQKPEVFQAITGMHQGLFPHAFCKILPDILGGDPEYCTVIHSDGKQLLTSVCASMHLSVHSFMDVCFQGPEVRVVLHTCIGKRRGI